MRQFLNRARHNQMRLFLPVVEYGLTEFAVTVRHIAPKRSVHHRGTFRLSRRTLGGNFDWLEPRPDPSWRGDEGPALRQQRGVRVPRFIFA